MPVHERLLLALVVVSLGFFLILILLPDPYIELAVHGPNPHPPPRRTSPQTTAIKQTTVPVLQVLQPQAPLDLPQQQIKLPKNTSSSLPKPAATAQPTIVPTIRPTKPTAQPTVSIPVQAIRDTTSHGLSYPSTTAIDQSPLATPQLPITPAAPLEKQSAEETEKPIVATPQTVVHDPPSLPAATVQQTVVRVVPLPPLPIADAPLPPLPVKEPLHAPPPAVTDQIKGPVMMISAARFHVAVVAYNRPKLLDNCLRSLLRVRSLILQESKCNLCNPSFA